MELVGSAGRRLDCDMEDPYFVAAVACYSTIASFCRINWLGTDIG